MVTSNQYQNKPYRQRTDQEWIDELSGKMGEELQQAAHEDLGRYLYKVAYNVLRKRQANVPMLRALDPSGLACHAQDFVQIVLEKIVRNQFAILEKFSGGGSFLSWVARVMHRQISSELRKAHWHRTDFLDDFVSGAWLKRNIATPESALLLGELRDRIHDAVKQLPERNLIAFVRCVVNGERPKVVASDLGITTNAVYLLVHRAKLDLRLQLHEYGPN